MPSISYVSYMDNAHDRIGGGDDVPERTGLLCRPSETSPGPRDPVRMDLAVTDFGM